MEHFRPKGRVTDEQWQIVYLDDKKEQVHPGYYWLAYDWRNLFPACIACNQASTNTDGTRAGKLDRFPVDGTRAVNPDDSLASEMARLIDPYLEYPDEHLKFDPDTGIVGPKTPKGKSMIEVLGLNRDGLKEFRKTIAEAAGDQYGEYVDAVKRDDPKEKARRKENFVKYENGEAPYSAFGKEAISRIRARMKAEL